jgi:carboxymethylenebutenolidase
MRKKSVSGSQLSPEQQAMEKLWEEHLASEFKFKSAEAAINTMVERPSVNHMPVMTGGVGRKQLTHFYDNYFIPQMPPDTQITPVSRTIGHDRLLMSSWSSLPIPYKWIGCCPEFPRRISRLKSRR